MKKIRHCNRIVQAFEHLLFHCVLMSALVRSKICGECGNRNTRAVVDVPGDPLQCWIPRTEPALRFGHCVCSVPSVFVYIIFVESSVVFGQPLGVC